MMSLLIAALSGSWTSAGAHNYIPRHDASRIQRLVNELKTRLDISQEVTVVIVPANPRLVSVESLKQADGAFLLSMEDGFLDGLHAEELEAVIAHELGHVWIFTHHPYLQTERLANQIAMRLVSREQLVRVYDKMWQHNGAKGDLARFLGEGPHHHSSLPVAIPVQADAAP